MKKYSRLILKRQDPRSKRYFASERKYLLKKLDKKLIFDIIHFGSTVVPKLKGKGMIDIFLIVKSKKQFPKMLNQILSRTDYIRPKFGGSKERIFHKRKRRINGKRVMFHLHVSWRSGKEWKNDILFTKYILRHPEAAKRYEELKYIWARRFNYDRKKYHDSKSRFVNPILRKAREEMGV